MNTMSVNFRGFSHASVPAGGPAGRQGRVHLEVSCGFAKGHGTFAHVVRPGKVSDDPGGGRDTHVTDKGKKPSVKKNKIKSFDLTR